MPSQQIMLEEENRTNIKRAYYGYIGASDNRFNNDWMGAPKTNLYNQLQFIGKKA